MSLQHLLLTQIKASDLERLVRDGVRESRDIDYKREWKMATDGDRREFLYDVASFANCGGGDLVYGITEEDGAPRALIGLEGFAQDREQTAAEESLTRGIAPRLSGVSFVAVPLSKGKVAFIVRVTRSSTGPHMVTHSEVNRFYSRHSTGRFQMNVEQLRSAFQHTAQASDRVRDFREKRVNRVATGDLGLKLWSKTALVLHVIPLATPPGFDLKRVMHMPDVPRPMGEISGYTPQMILDGLLIRSSMANEVIDSYCLVFRDGAIEAVMPNPAMERQRIIDPTFESVARQALRNFITFHRKVGATPPFFVGLSLVNVGGFTMGIHDPIARLRGMTTAVDRSHLVLPMTTAESGPESVDALLRPAFDMVWNACGYSGSPNYDEEGNWKKTDY
jgi:hypothetical protein